MGYSQNTVSVAGLLGMHQVGLYIRPVYKELRILGKVVENLRYLRFLVRTIGALKLWT